MNGYFEGMNGILKERERECEEGERGKGRKSG